MPAGLMPTRDIMITLSSISLGTINMAHIACWSTVAVCLHVFHWSCNMCCVVLHFLQETIWIGTITAVEPF